MKQKLIFVLSLMAMAWSSALYAAERVAPTLPTAQTPESGKSHWIYNVGAENNFIVNMLGAIAAYCMFPKKPCINVQRTLDTQLTLF